MFLLYLLELLIFYQSPKKMKVYICFLIVLDSKAFVVPTEKRMPLSSKLHMSPGGFFNASSLNEPQSQKETILFPLQRTIPVVPRFSGTYRRHSTVFVMGPQMSKNSPVSIPLRGPSLALPPAGPAHLYRPQVYVFRPPAPAPLPPVENRGSQLDARSTAPDPAQPCSTRVAVRSPPLAPQAQRPVSPLFVFLRRTVPAVAPPPVSRSGPRFVFATGRAAFPGVLFVPGQKTLSAHVTSPRLPPGPQPSLTIRQPQPPSPPLPPAIIPTSMPRIPSLPSIVNLQGRIIVIPYVFAPHNRLHKQKLMAHPSLTTGSPTTSSAVSTVGKTSALATTVATTTKGYTTTVDTTTGSTTITTVSVDKTTLAETTISEKNISGTTLAATTTATTAETTVAETTVAEMTVAETTVAEMTVAETAAADVTLITAAILDDTTTAETTVAETTVAEMTVPETTVAEMTVAGTAAADITLITAAILDDTTTAETTVAETTVAETTTAETTIAETTVAETTIAETTVAETTAAETTVAETTVAETTTAKTTVAETTTAETTVAETTVAETTTAETVAETTTAKKTV
ncbi:uncharacterized protein [Lepisosteus oculatus]|uniref:uncharacterized protein n=1 Tax=Lepisosteus oculatus TaxID=7918 RepID=UPI003712F1FA